MTNKATLLRERSILSALLALALPTIGANLLQAAYQLVDTFWVGRLGGEAVAAVSAAVPVWFVVSAFGGGTAVAGSILVAQYAGAEKQSMVTHVTGQTLMLVLVVAFCVAAMGYAVTPPVMREIGVATDVLPDAVRYLQISFLGAPLLFLYVSCQSVLRGVGEVKIPFYIVLLTVILNLVLDPLFIFGWGPVPASGVAGAAYATVVTQAVAAVLGLYSLTRERFGVYLLDARLTLDPALIRRMVRLAIPGSVEQTARALGMTAIMVLVTGFGTAALAAYGVGVRLSSLVMIIGMGLSMATGTLVGHNMGAADPQQAKRVARLGVGVSFLGLTFCGALMFVYAEPLVRFFVPEDTRLIQDGADLLRIMAPFYGFIGVQLVLIGVFRSAGDVVTAMLLAILAVWLFEFPIAYALSSYTPLGVFGIWWSFPSANVLAASLAALLYWRGSWQRLNLASD